MITRIYGIGLTQVELEFIVVHIQFRLQLIAKKSEPK